MNSTRKSLPNLQHSNEWSSNKFFIRRFSWMNHSAGFQQEIQMYNVSLGKRSISPVHLQLELCQLWRRKALCHCYQVHCKSKEGKACARAFQFIKSNGEPQPIKWLQKILQVRRAFSSSQPANQQEINCIKNSTPCSFTIHLVMSVRAEKSNSWVLPSVQWVRQQLQNLHITLFHSLQISSDGWITGGKWWLDAEATFWKS